MGALPLFWLEQTVLGDASKHMTEELQRPSFQMLCSYGVSLLMKNLARCRGLATVAVAMLRSEM